MKLYTIQLAKHRLLKDSGIELVDTTVKSGLKILAPSWEILNAYRANENQEEAEKIYVKAFYSKLRKDYRENPEEFIKWLKQGKPIALACYCRAGKFCHRHLLVDIFIKIGKKLGIDVEYVGEIQTLENIHELPEETNKRLPSEQDS